ncbi:MAG: glycosyltransferase family 87 protein [Gemmataceae bacterium]
MHLDAIPSRLKSQAHWERWAIIAWLVVVSAVCIRGFIAPYSHSCWHQYYRQAGLNWCAGHDLYEQLSETCRYSPLVHAGLVPLSLLPDRLGALGWRLLNTVVFLGGLFWWACAVLPETLSRKQRAALFLLALPLTFGNINNAQANLLMLGLILAGLAAVSEGRWNLAAICIALSCLLKLYALSVGMLLLLVHPRRLGPRYATALLVGLALPFLLQQPHYVARQYVNWLINLWADDRSDWAFAGGYRDLWLLLRLWHVPITRHGYVAIQLLAAASVALLCLFLRLRDWPPRRLLTALLGLSACWMTVCGPATESSTYCLLAPSLAWAVLEAFEPDGGKTVRGMLLTSYGLLVASQLIGISPWVTQFHSLGPQPLGGLLFFGALAYKCLLGGLTSPMADRLSIPPQARAA